MEEMIMKKILIMLFVVTGLVLATAVVASATSQEVTGSGTIGSSTSGSSMLVNTSTNVNIIYEGSSQTYGATAKHKAGNKVYATAGGQGNLSGIYFQQDDNSVGHINSTNVTSTFATVGNWIAQ